MTTVYKITLWISKGHPVPVEIVLMGYKAEEIARSVFTQLTGYRNYSHGHLISYEAESPNIIPDVADTTTLCSFDYDYLDYGDGDEDDENEDDDFDDEGYGDLERDPDPPDDEDGQIPKSKAQGLAPDDNDALLSPVRTGH